MEFKVLATMLLHNLHFAPRVKRNMSKSTCKAAKILKSL